MVIEDTKQIYNNGYGTVKLEHMRNSIILYGGTIVHLKYVKPWTSAGAIVLYYILCGEHF